MIVGIIDYGMGNIKSVYNAVKFLGYNCQICTKGEELDQVTHLILPGVGAFPKGIKNLKELFYENLIYNVLEKEKPILGICLGMQMMMKSSDEFGVNKGLGWFDFSVNKINFSEVNKLPLVGWEEIEITDPNCNLFDGLDNSPSFYFVHSYYVPFDENDSILAYYEVNGLKIAVAFKSKNIFATQFHPEKSQKNGLNLLENFLSN